MLSKYCNTDLDIESSEDLSTLVPIFEEKCCVLHAEELDNGRWMVRVEPSRAGEFENTQPNPEDDILELVGVVNSLDTNAKRVLANADTFDFNIGWESDNKLPQHSFSLSNTLLNRIAGIGATLTVTVYPTEEAYPNRGA